MKQPLHNTIALGLLLAVLAAIIVGLWIAGHILGCLASAFFGGCGPR